MDSVDSCPKVAAPVGEMDNEVEATEGAWHGDVPTLLLFCRLRSLSSVAMASLIWLERPSSPMLPDLLPFMPRLVGLVNPGLTTMGGGSAMAGIVVPIRGAYDGETMPTLRRIVNAKLDRAKAPVPALLPNSWRWLTLLIWHSLHRRC